MKARQHLEESTIGSFLKMSKINIYPNEVAGSSSEKLFGYLKNYHLYLYQDSIIHHRDMIDNILNPIAATKQAEETEMTKHKHDIKQLKKDISTALEHLDKAKKSLLASKTSFESSKAKFITLEIAAKDYVMNKINEEELALQRQQAFSPSSSCSNSSSTSTSTTTLALTSISSSFGMFSTTISSAFESNPVNDRNKQKAKCLSRYNTMKQYHEDMAIKKKDLAVAYDKYDTAVDAACKAFETFEIRRLIQTKHYLKEYCLLERQSIEKKLKHLVELETAVSDMNPESDLKLFIMSEKIPEVTHKLSTTLQLLDWDFQRRCNFCSQEDSVSHQAIAENQSTDQNDPNISNNRNSTNINNINQNDSITTAQSFDSFVASLTWRDMAVVRNELPTLPFPQTTSTDTTIISSNDNSFNDDVLPTVITTTKPKSMTASLAESILFDMNYFNSSGDERSNKSNTVTAPSINTNNNKNTDECSNKSCNNKTPSQKYSKEELSMIYNSIKDSTEVEDENEKDIRYTQTRETADEIAIIKNETLKRMINLSTDDNINITTDNNSNDTTKSPSTLLNDVESESEKTIRQLLDLHLHHSDSKDDDYYEDKRNDNDDNNEIAKTTNSNPAQASSTVQSAVLALVGTDNNKSNTNTNTNNNNNMDKLIEAISFLFDFSNDDISGNEDTNKIDLMTESTWYELLNDESNNSSTSNYNSTNLIIEISNNNANNIYIDNPTNTNNTSNIGNNSSNATSSSDSSKLTPMNYLLQQLDDKRSSRAQMPLQKFMCMTKAMQACLDHCFHTDDVKSAMRVANMANTFHTIMTTATGQLQLEEAYQDSTSNHAIMALSTTDNTSTPSSSSPSSSTSQSQSPPIPTKVYIQQQPVIRHHVLWREEGFWDAYLMNGLASELEKRGQAVLWDELSTEALQETVLSIHNLIFGQLGTLIMTMYEVGLTQKEIQSKINKFCQVTQIGEEQSLQLLSHIQQIFKKQHQ